METPLWILAISQLFVDVLIVVLIVTLIIAAILMVKIIKRLGGKAEHLLDEATDAVDYVKESKIASVLRKIFAPSGFKVWKKKKKDAEKIVSF